jgi:hypothetical protein
MCIGGGMGAAGVFESLAAEKAGTPKAATT